MSEIEPSHSSKPSHARFPEEEKQYYALLENNPKAWEELYLNVMKTFIPYVLNRSSISSDDAYDLLQEGLAICLANIRDKKFVFQGKPIAAYANAICQKQWLSHLRRTKNNRFKIYQEPTANEVDLIDDLIQGNESEDSALEKELAESQSIWSDDDQEADYEALDRARNELGRQCQVMIDCFYVQGKSLAECGEILGIQEGSAKVKRFRCVQRLKELYLGYRKK
ncbi:RNA polymerase sigma factor [Siphonobacter sp. SORGH_AS_1065]|uniref:RNA polymerase sigma factor n=1 Tax=Siphonobacter sp. SORGH_AS_1065 TaxID=3041795 RepID=UPI00278166FA|nr:sigma-70 family RNA polymerase sigma factor [Siphonobacter sp. SORGH_AS_1065]MDQ1089700.1 RNA polymerase sigma factor (sigma-70 family) [Siphonobacter sp. SORGH_AS_1065]